MALDLELVVLTLDDIVCGDVGQNWDDSDCAHPEDADTVAAYAASQSLAPNFTLLRHEARSARGESARADVEARMRACERSFIVACAQRRLRVQQRALAWLDGAEDNGTRLALASTLTSRMVCAVMEAQLGEDWADRFAVVATSDSLSVHEGEEEIYRLILRTTATPAHHALLVTASRHSEAIACGIGMQAVRLNAQASPPSSSLDRFDAEKWLVSRSPAQEAVPRQFG